MTEQSVDPLVEKAEIIKRYLQGHLVGVEMSRIQRREGIYKGFAGWMDDILARLRTEPSGDSAPDGVDPSQDEDLAHAVALEVLCRVFEDGADEGIEEWREWYDPSKWMWWARGLGAFIHQRLERLAPDGGEMRQEVRNTLTEAWRRLQDARVYAGGEKTMLWILNHLETKINEAQRHLASPPDSEERTEDGGRNDDAWNALVMKAGLLSRVLRALWELPGYTHIPGNSVEDDITDLARRLTFGESERWRPIDTAPRDGTSILVHDNNAPGLPTGRADECWAGNTDVAEWWQGENGGNGAWICFMSAVRDPELHFTPTHWRPLPPPPSADGSVECSSEGEGYVSDKAAKALGRVLDPSPTPPAGERESPGPPTDSCLLCGHKRRLVVWDVRDGVGCCAVCTSAARERQDEMAGLSTAAREEMARFRKRLEEIGRPVQVAREAVINRAREVVSGKGQLNALTFAVAELERQERIAAEKRRAPTTKEGEDG